MDMDAGERPQWGALSSMMDQLRSTMRRTGDIQQRMSKLTGEAWSDDRLIKATVGPRGQLVSLELDARIYRKPNSSALAEKIVSTVRSATEDVLRKSQEIFNESIPSDLRGGGGEGSGLQQMMGRHDADVLKEAKDS